MEGIMIGTRDMETNVYELLSKFIREKDDDTPNRLAEQDAELKRLMCTDPVLGRWIEVNDFPFLIETLTLNDAVFSGEYPTVDLSSEERKRLMSALEAHCESCARCGRKRGYDLEWQSRVDRAIADNHEVIGRAVARDLGKD
jgi:hypothetical protein